VFHNLAKLEPHIVDQERRLLCAHRKGVIWALPAWHPAALQAAGQPVLVPGSVGAASRVLAGSPIVAHPTGRATGRAAK
jgi:tRNA-splicing ligase RtcB